MPTHSLLSLNLGSLLRSVVFSVLSKPAILLLISLTFLRVWVRIQGFSFSFQSPPPPWHPTGVGAVDSWVGGWGGVMVGECSDGTFVFLGFPQGQTTS